MASEGGNLIDPVVLTEDLPLGTVKCYDDNIIWESFAIVVQVPDDFLIVEQVLLLLLSEAVSRVGGPALDQDTSKSTLSERWKAWWH